MRILIVDDELPARERLRRLLARQPGVTGVLEAADGIEALARIDECKPDALFLDIEMPELSGIELAASLPEPAPPVVFVTAWNQYAIDAFEAGAIDYLLKPCEEARLAKALQRLRERLGAMSGMSGTAGPGPASLPVLPLRQLLVSERGLTRVVPVAEIQWLESADNYVALHTASGSPLLRQTLAGLATRLEPDFVRCHRRAAVQLSWVEGIAPLDKGDCELLLRGGARVPCSRQYRAQVVEKLQAV